jgi:hypothetical protein
MTAPGDALLHPVALASLGCLVVNDHVLKLHAPGLISGKLSDVAILVVGPLLLQGGAELVAARGGRSWRPSGRALSVAAAVTCAAYVLEKTAPAATEVYRLVWGALRWPLDGVAAWAQGRAWPAYARAAAVTDPSDLVALPAVAGAWWAQRGRASAPAVSATTR